MASSVTPLVLHRHRGGIVSRLPWRLFLLAVAAGVLWVSAGLSIPVRGVLVALPLALALRPSRAAHRTLTLDVEGLRRGRGHWPWSALTSVQLGAPANPDEGPPLGGVTLRFGDEAVSFGRDWPLEALLVEVLARAPLEAQLARALDQRERQHGLAFGALWVGPRFLELRHEGRTARAVALEDVREVSLELTERQALLRAETAEGPLEVPLVELSNPHVLATLLIRHRSRGSTARVPVVVKPPAPTPAPAPQPPPRRRAPSRAKTRVARGSPGPLPFMAMLGGAGLLGLGLTPMLEAVASQEWQAVPAVITSTRTWKTQIGPKKKTVEHGAIRFSFVFNGVEREGDRYDHFGTDERQARSLEVGQRVTAYVPADRPWLAVLERDIPTGSYLLTFFGALITGSGLLMFFLWLWGRLHA